MTESHWTPGVRPAGPDDEDAPGRGSRLRAVLAPTLEQWIDIAFTLGLTLMALAVLRTTFTGYQFLLVGGIGAVLGILAAHACTATRVPWVLVPIVLAVVFFVFGGAAALWGDPHGHALPDWGTLQELGRLVTDGWRQMLTTLPPVDGTGPLIVLPFVLGLAGAGIVLTAAQRTMLAGVPLAFLTVLFVGTVALGTSDPGSLVLPGLVIGGGALCWASLRARRHIVQTGSGRRSQFATAAGILAVALLAAGFAAPFLPGTGVKHRAVARTHVTPPLDLSAFPTPLVGFRKYRPVTPETLANTTLLTVRGLPTGTPLRIATLDDYNGVVWAVRNDPAAPAVGDALNTFQRVGASVTPPTTGRRVTLHVTVGTAYAQATDTNSWLPDTGYLTDLSFAGSDGDAHAESVRYNLATGTAVMPDKLRSGDRYTVQAVLPTTATFRPLPASASAGSAPTIDPSDYAFVAPYLVQLLGTRGGDAWQQLGKVAALFRAGAYSDGGTDEGQYLPGHNIGRLTSFFKGQQFVGDDEQYASAYALVANDLGIPARVVVGAVPESDGKVLGKDIHAWVELELDKTGWTAVPRTVFTPPETNKPKPQTQEQEANSDASVVPPPNAVRPPSSLDELAQAGSNSSRRAQKDSDSGGAGGLPGYVKASLTYGLPPVAFLVLVAFAIVLVKALRRRHRRRSGTPASQVVAGWTEILDQARDLGLPVDVRLTRREQAVRLEDQGIGHAAERADRVNRAVFAATLAHEDESTDFWVDVRRLRRDMLLGVGRWRRLRARLSLRSLRPSRARVGRVRTDPS